MLDATRYRLSTFCLGAPLARLEVRAALDPLLYRLPELRARLDRVSPTPRL